MRSSPSVQPFPLSRLLSEAPSPGRGVGEREGGDKERGLGGSAGSRATGKCLNNRTDAAALASLGCGEVGGGCNWSCSLGLPALSAAEQNPARASGAGRGPPDAPLSPQHSRRAGKARQPPPAPGSHGAPIPRRRCRRLFQHRLRQLPPPPPPAASVRTLPR